MLPGQGSSDGTSSALTVDSAAKVFEGLLSGEPEDTQDREAQTADDAGGADPAEEAAHDTDESEASETADESEQSADEEDAEPAPPQPKTHRLKINGEDVEVTEEELLRGYSRTQDYTRKTQQVAEQRKALDTETASVREERAKYAQQLEQLSTALQSLAPKEPDWNDLREQLDPGEFASVWAQWQQHKQRVEAVEAERKRAVEKVAEDQRTQFQGYLDEQKAKLIDAVPAWKDDATAKKERGELAEYAKALGFTEQELAQVVDHRVVVVLRNAMLHDRAEKARAKVQKKVEAVKAATPGPAATQRRPTSDITRAKQRLAKTGSVDDAAQVFLQMFDD